ncbi:MAG: hypothetical protein RJB38_12 [Pseudomonadota bacterium]|jgi:septum formation protein
MKLLLASSSPRRIDLLKQAQFEVRVISPDCDEAIRRGETPRAMVRRLAYEKALVVANRVMEFHGDPARSESLVIAADTTVVEPGGGRCLGKPVDARDAERILSRIQGRTHEVLTGYCVLELKAGSVVRKLVRVVSSKVAIRSLSKGMIRAYVASGEPMDKAGAYAAQGFGMNFIASIRGSYTNVVGLPMCELLTDLEQTFGVTAPALGLSPARAQVRKRASSRPVARRSEAR